MNNKLEKFDFSFVKTFEYMMNFHVVFLFIFGVFLFDSLDIIFYGNGIFNTDFSNFFNFSTIQFFLLFLISFGVITAGLSILVKHIMFKLFWRFLYKFILFIIRVLKIEFNPKSAKNKIFISPLYDTALITENTFLLKFIEKENKSIYKLKNFHHIIYSLLIAIIINFILTFFYDKNTILDFIVITFKNNDFFIKILLLLLIIPVTLTICYGIYHSITFDDEKIYFPDEKYNLLEEEIKSPLNKNDKI